MQRQRALLRALQAAGALARQSGGGGAKQLAARSWEPSTSAQQHALPLVGRALLSARRGYSFLPNAFRAEAELPRDALRQV
jgi:hypothetical protein